MLRYEITSMPQPSFLKAGTPFVLRAKSRLNFFTSEILRRRSQSQLLVSVANIYSDVRSFTVDNIKQWCQLL